MVPALHSAAKRRIESTGITVTIRTPMLRNVPAIVASPVRKTL